MAAIKNAVDAALQITSPRMVYPAATINYTWVKYGTSAAGAGLNDSPTGMSYIGFAFNKLTATESTVASDYVWSLIQGTNGTNGTAGQSARRAYVVNTVATAPLAVTAGTGDVIPTSTAGTWSFTATSTLSAGQYMYQVDGIYTSGGNIAWGNPYLSNLKVGSLSALSANIGVITAGNATFTTQVVVGTYSTSCIGTGGGQVGVRGEGTQWGVIGVTSTVGGAGIYAATTYAGGRSLAVVGTMTINNNTLVSNLNANYLEGTTSSGFLKGLQDSSGVLLNTTNSKIILASNTSSLTWGANGTGPTMTLQSVSDRKIKKDIKPEAFGLDFINKLKPVTFRLKKRDEWINHGFIAQDVGELIGEINFDALYTETNDIKGVSYLDLLAPIVKAIQELSAKITELEDKQ